MSRLLSLATAAALAVTVPTKAAVIYQSTIPSFAGTADLYDELNDPAVATTGSLWVTISTGSFSYAEWQINGEQQILWWEDIGEDEPYLNGNEYIYSPFCTVTPGTPTCGTTPLSVKLLGPKLIRMDFVRPADFNNCIPFQEYGDCAESYSFTGAAFTFIAQTDETTLFRIHDSNPVPEPATWAMLIAGFGLVGAAMRARQRAAATA